MSQPAWPQAFPGGVADAELQHALWRDRSGKMVALRLADGQLLWRSAEPLWPLLLGHNIALGLALSPPRVVALALDKAGAERWRSDTLPWPEWASHLDTRSSAMDVHAGWLGQRILLHWHLQPAYTGGAVPGRSRAKPAAAAASCLLDAASGALEPAPVAFDSARPEPAPQEPSDDPQVLAQQQLGGVRYRLLQRVLPGAPGDTLHTVLIAHDLARGQDLWQCALDETRAKAPRALRS